MNLMALFYKKTLLAEAGYTEPPKTMEEMYEMAVNTQSSSDGTIDVMGYPDFPSVYYTDNFAAAQAAAGTMKTESLRRRQRRQPHGFEICGDVP